MAFARLFKACQDFVLGFQTFNQAIANEEDTRAVYAFEHVSPDDGGAVPAGRHFAQRIPKAIVTVAVETFETFAGTSGTANLGIAVAPYVFGLERLGAGQYFIRTQGLTETSFAPFALLGVTSSGPTQVRMGTARWETAMGGFIVSLMEQPTAGAAFEPTDFSFSVAIFSE